MRIIRGTITDPAYCEALEAGAPVEITRRTLHHEVVAIVDRVQAVFQNPGVDALGVVVTDALYSALGSLSFVADVAEEAGL